MPVFGMSLRLACAYVFDWIVIVVIAAGGAALNYITGYHRPFSLTDPALAYPLKSDIISITVAGLIAFAVPAVIIVCLSLLLSPRPLPSTASRSTVWQRKLWDINAGLLGLALSCAVTLLVTAGLKDMVGKPRPDLLARCNADVANIQSYIVGGFGTSLDSEAQALVTSGICRQSDHHFLDDGFASWPSGHSSFSWAGLLYLTLWLSCRFSIAIPYLGPTVASSFHGKENAGLASDELVSSVRTRQAAPPVWLMVIAFFPCGVALFICSSRYADFHHAGWDIIAGAAIGILFAWTSFRTYHLPIRRGMGTSWGPRKDHRAFFAGVESGEQSVSHVNSVRGGHGAPAGMYDEESGQPRRIETGESGEEMITYADNRNAYGHHTHANHGHDRSR